MRLITSMEYGTILQSKGIHRWFCLEFGYIHIILNMHLQNGITGTSGLHFNCAPSIRNLKKHGTKKHLVISSICIS